MDADPARREVSAPGPVRSGVRAMGDALVSSLPSLDRRAQVGAAAVVVGVVVLAVAGGLTAAGLAVLALAALVTAFQRPYLLGPFVAVLLPAGEHVHVLQAQVAPLEAVVGGGAIGYLLRVATRREAVRFRLADWAFAALLVFIGLSTLGPADNSDQIRELLFWGALGVVFHAIGAHFDIRRDLRLFLVALGVAVLLEASWALFQYLDRWAERYSLLDGAIVFPLPRGTLEHPNALAQFLVLGGLVVVALSLAEKGALRQLGFLGAGAGALALVVTFSRASWIALGLGSAVYLFDRRTRRPVLAVGAVAGVSAAALALLSGGAIGERISSLFHGEVSDLYDFRLDLVRRAARLVADHPLTGLGDFEEVGVYAGRPDLATHPHNLFLGIAVFFGIPAAVAFGGLVALALRASWRRYRSRADERQLTALGFAAALVAFLANGLLEYPFWNASLTALAVLVLAVAISLEVPDSSSDRAAHSSAST